MHAHSRKTKKDFKREEGVLPRLAIVCLIAAVVAGVLGFTKLGSSAMFFSRIMIVIFLILAVIAFGVGKLRAG